MSSQKIPKSVRCKCVKTFVCIWVTELFPEWLVLLQGVLACNYSLEAHFFMVNSNDGIKTEASIDYDMGTCLWSVADQFNITKLILFRVSHRICGVIANNLSGQYMKYLLVWI